MQYFLSIAWDINPSFCSTRQSFSLSQGSFVICEEDNDNYEVLKILFSLCLNYIYIYIMVHFNPHIIYKIKQCLH